jgi:hypothetical protein
VQAQLADGNDAFTNTTSVVTAVNASDGDDTCVGSHLTVRVGCEH